MEHWKKKIHDQELIIIIIIFTSLRRLQSLYLMRKQQEVNRINTVGYKITKEKNTLPMYFNQEKRTEEEIFFPH